MILLDAMGGDNAPDSIIKGAILALENDKFSSSIGLVGVQEIIEKKLKEFNFDNSEDRIKIFHASQVVEMHDSPTSVLKEKKDSSIIVGLNLHKKGIGKAFISAGSTGAMVASSLIVLGRIKGIARPAIGIDFPTLKGSSLVLDMGATVDCKPKQLFQFALMGHIYKSIMSENSNPSIGLLSVGEEDTKGNEMTIKTHQLLKEADFNFIGNVEGKDIPVGETDIVVCDGFVGNIILKFAEGMGTFIGSTLKDEPNALKKIGAKFDYQSRGGAPLFGVDGISIISHGKSSDVAMMNALINTELLVKQEFNKKIEENVKKYSDILK